MATPLTAVTVAGAAQRAARRVGAEASVMLAVDDVTVLPWASFTATCTAGAMAAPAVVLLGWALKTSAAAGARHRRRRPATSRG